MTQNKNTEKHKIITLPVAAFEPSPTNPRQSFNPEKLAQLASSVKERGVLQAILARKNPRHREADGKGKEYEIIAGERRWRAAKLAKLAGIPTRVVQMSDEAVLQVQIIENLQREEVHPLDEAEGFAHLRNVSGYAVAEIAQRVAKDERYVARRMALTNLTPEARDDYRAESITLAHALELCRLAPDVQRDALAACYERTNTFDRETQTWTARPNKERPAHHVRYLREWVEQNVLLNLNKAAFKKDDARLREDGLTCLECPQRSGANAGLFHDIRGDAQCLNPTCFASKLERFIQIKRAEIAAQAGAPPAYISTHYNGGSRGGGEGGEGAERTVIGARDYHVIERRGVRCESAERAIYADGPEVGRVKWICRDPRCKDHRGRAHDSYARPVARTTNGGDASDMDGEAKAVAQRNARKQELFDLRVDEAVRKRVFAEAVKTYGWPPERADLDRVAYEFFRRVPSDDQRTIAEVFGIEAEKLDAFRHDPAALLAELAGMTEAQIGRFLALCSFAHLGSNQWMHNAVDQTSVTELAERRGVNHELIDAEVRCALAPKKYKAAHQKHLDAVKRDGGGGDTPKPVVFERAAEMRRAA